MKRIGVLSDTHGIVPAQVYDFFKDCDQIWHAGDVGSIDVLEELNHFKPTIAVYGNIDGSDIMWKTEEVQVFSCEEMKVIMTHIGGYPPKYMPKSLELIKKEKPNIFISGHSHILKVMYDKQNEILHINPGAAGKYGFHKVCTLVRFTIDGNRATDMEINEFPKF